MLPKEIITSLESYWKEKGVSSIISKIQSIGGGSINQAFLIETQNTSYFLKYNTAASHPNMFTSELKGLKLLSNTKTIRIPETSFAYEGKDYSCILMEFIKTQTPQNNFWQMFADKLSMLHSHSSNFFGLDFHNYMGSLTQSNTKHSKFDEFFIEQRLEPQIKLARNSGFLNSKHVKQTERLFQELSSIFPQEKPALVHGDLWSGNFMSDKLGKPVLIDPASYYGHREVDIAMTIMFGGFPPAFYDSYQQIFPMDKGWEERLPYYNLYPILVHINLFGKSYLPSFERVINRF